MEDKTTHLHDRYDLIPLISKQVMYANEHHTKLGLIILDIKRFSRLNNLYGYSVGDAILQKVARILEQTKRDHDHALRVGNDRFALLLPDVMNQGHVQLAVQKLLRLLEVPFDVDDKKIKIEATVGFAVCPLHSSHPDGLMKAAEEALSVAQRNNQKFHVAKPMEQNEGLSEFWDIEIELDDAINSSRMVLFYQPKISLVKGHPVGAEALVRWSSPSRGFISPNVFIPIAEETGQIKPLTIWALNVALRQAAEWTDQWGPMVVSVNIPPQMMTQPDFIDLVTSATGIWKNPNVILCLEITERTLIGDPEYIFGVLKELRALGIKVSIDDFGTGYSSLSYFKNIPTDELKIDQSFVGGLLTDKADSNIVQLVIDLAHRFDLSVVAEGVEDLETVKALAQLRCDVIQGYYFAKPMSHKQFQPWLKEFKCFKKKS